MRIMTHSRQASINAQCNSLIPNRNSWASSPIIERSKLYHNWQDKSKRRKYFSAWLCQ